MENKKRVLPWTWNPKAQSWSAETKMGTYRVDPVLDEFRLTISPFGMMGKFPTTDEGIDAAEEEHFLRCSEFLPVAGPGEVVVPERVAIDAHDVAVSSRCFWRPHPGMLVRCENAIEKLSAILEKAKEGGRRLDPETTTVPRERLADLERLAVMVVEAPCGGVDDPSVYQLARRLTRGLSLFDWRERR